MKKILLFIVFLILIQIVIAGDMYKIDIEKNDQTFFTLKERDLMRFDWKDKEHKIMVRQINEDKKSVDLTIYVDGAPTPQYVSVSPTRFVKVDFDLDRIDDLQVRLDSIEGSNVTLGLTKIKEEKINSITGNAVKDLKIDTKIGWSIVVGIIVLGLVVYSFVLRKGRNKDLE